MQSSSPPEHPQPYPCISDGAAKVVCTCLTFGCGRRELANEFGQVQPDHQITSATSRNHKKPRLRDGSGLSDAGAFQPLCKNTLLPSAPLQFPSNTRLSTNRPSAPIGISPKCGIPQVDHDGSISNVANIAVGGASMFVVVVFIYLCNRRKAAVGRAELRSFLFLYLLTLPLQLLTTGSILEQGSVALTVLTAVHAGMVTATFWALLANGIVATQVVEGWTLSSLIPFFIFSFLFFGVTTYISLDIGISVTDLIGGVSDPPDRLGNIPLFVFTSIWPAAAAFIYLLIMAYIVLRILNETRPMWFYLLSALLFVLSQLAWFLLGRVLCDASDSKVDGSFLATLLETAAVGVLYLGWKSITEESWDDEYYPS